MLGDERLCVLPEERLPRPPEPTAVFAITVTATDGTVASSVFTGTAAAADDYPRGQGDDYRVTRLDEPTPPDDAVPVAVTIS